MACCKRLKSKAFRTRKAVLGFPLAMRTFIAAKLQKILITFSQKILNDLVLASIHKTRTSSLNKGLAAVVLYHPFLFNFVKVSSIFPPPSPHPPSIHTTHTPTCQSPAPMHSCLPASSPPSRQGSCQPGR